MVVTVACERQLSPLFFFVFEHFFYSSTTHILYIPVGPVNTFMIKKLCITLYLKTTPGKGRLTLQDRVSVNGPDIAKF
jgi:hypothetical protein